MATATAPAPSVLDSGRDLLAKFSPRELMMLFSGGEVTTSKPKPDPVPDPVVQTVNLSTKSNGSHGDTVVTNHVSWLAQAVPHFGGGSLFGDHSSPDPNSVKISATIEIRRKDLAGIDVADVVADVVAFNNELMSNHVTMQLVSNELDPATGTGKLSSKVTIEHFTKLRELFIPTIFKFNLDFHVPKNFGTPGALIVNNGHRNLVLDWLKFSVTSEFLLQSASVTMPDKTVIAFNCNSWVFPSEKNSIGRVFFSNKVYTPDQTPAGLQKLRAGELKEIQGDGTGVRKEGERIYDYDVYNDLGTPKDPRHTLGGSAEFPYPRRCRTGRKLNADGKTETRVNAPLETNYIPRDESFDEVKKSGFLADSLKGKRHNIIADLFDPDKNFGSLREIYDLYAPPGQEAKIETVVSNQNQPFQLLHEFFLAPGDNNNTFKYPTPRVIAKNKNAWTEDIEFARQVLAGMNPMLIELLTEFPIKSQLKVNYDPTSAITEEHIKDQLEGMSVSEALAKKKFFTLDYHDRLLGYVQRINDLKTSQCYATRTLFFLTSEGILKPVAIELSLPGKTDGDRPIARVLCPPKDSTKDWAWELAKAHVLSNDASFHQVISHWLRTHAAIEPFIIATNRQLSVMHPVFKAIVSHYKDTMDINQSARSSLINAGGIVEQTFTPQKYAIEISSVVYRGWRFVDQALPNDLIKRGMAVPDASAPHGLRLTIPDYPYAVDGLELWDAILTWVKNHLDIFYADDAAVLADKELQTWWSELRTRGHPDITEGWLPADSKANLAQIITTVAWVASCHHAAVNFGQFMYAGFMPNHPSMTRKLIPDEGTPEWQSLQKDPETFLLSMLANSTQAKVNMTTVEILSTHAPNEEYLGERPKDWTSDDKVWAEFNKFSQRVEEIDALIKKRNQDPAFKNRHGPAQLPYELLQPKSGPGLTGKGIPNSISI